MKHRRSSVVRACAAGAVLGIASLGAASGASGQAGQSLKPPSVNETDEPPTIRMYLVAVLLGALVVGANLTPSKRGHQD